MKKRNALIAFGILNGMLQEKMAVSTAMSISKCLTVLEKVRKDHEAEIESVLKTVEGFEAYRSARQAVVAHAQRNQGNRQIQQEAGNKLREIDEANPIVVKAVRELDVELEKGMDEELKIEVPTLELPSDMQIEGSKIVELSKAGLL
jgi:hypothetical protein